MEDTEITMDANNSISIYKINCRCLEHTSVGVNILDCKANKQEILLLKDTHKYVLR